MKAKIFVVELPTFDTVVDEISSIFNDVFDFKTKTCEQNRKCCETPKSNEDLTPPKFRVNKPCGNTQPWGIYGNPADENMRFGYGLNVDEPRYQDFSDDDEFLEAREAFDDFVDAGERCVELGLDKRNDAPITKCNAIRKPIGCKPPMNKELIGESQFPWWKLDCDWKF